MDTTDKGLVAQIENRFLAELAREPGIDLQLIEDLTHVVSNGELATEPRLLQLFERLGTDEP